MSEEKPQPKMFLVWEVYGEEQNRKKIKKLEIFDDKFEGVLEDE